MKGKTADIAELYRGFLGQCANLALLRMQSPDTSEWASRLVGDYRGIDKIVSECMGITTGKERSNNIGTNAQEQVVDRRALIEPMKKIARQFRKHRPLILNCFRAKKLFSSGIVEGFNNKAKVTLRKAYGFRTFSAMEIALFHQLGKLPEPKFTHTYW